MAVSVKCQHVFAAWIPSSPREFVSCVKKAFQPRLINSLTSLAVLTFYFCRAGTIKEGLSPVMQLTSSGLTGRHRFAWLTKQSVAPIPAMPHLRQLSHTPFPVPIWAGAQHMAPTVHFVVSAVLRNGRKEISPPISPAAVGINSPPYDTNDRG